MRHNSDGPLENASPRARNNSFHRSIFKYSHRQPLINCHLLQFILCLWTDLPLCRTVFEGFEEVLDFGLGTSPFSDGVVSLIGPGKGAGSWIIRTSSLLCWPRCCLAKSKPFTLGACSCERRTKTKNRNHEWQSVQRLWLRSANNGH